MSREGYCIRNPTRASQFSTISSYVSLKHLEQCAPFIIIYEPRTMCSKCNAPLPSRVCVYIVILYSTTCIGNFDLQQPWLTTRPICRTLTQVPRHTLVRSLPHSLSHSFSLLPRESFFYPRSGAARADNNERQSFRCKMQFTTRSTITRDRNRVYYRRNIFPLFTPVPVA